MESMTGFGAAEGARPAGEGGRGASWRWDLRSVNNKGLEVRLRVPAGWDRCEAEWRGLVGARFKRGSVSLALTVTETAERAALVLNSAALEAAVAAAQTAERALATAGVQSSGVRVDGLLALKGVLGAEAAETTPLSQTDAEAVGATLLDALDALAAARAEEGARLQAVLEGRLDEIERLTALAEAQAAARTEEQKGRLAVKVATLMEAGADISEDRLAQELAMLAVKADVAEEIERLKIHVASARDLIASDGPIGRKLDFLTQEFNREANTLCAKSQDPQLTDTGIALKVVIDQLREQAANVA